MDSKLEIDQLPPTNTDLLNYIIEGRKEVRQLQNAIDELTRQVKRLGRPSSIEEASLQGLAGKISLESSTKTFMLRNVPFFEIEGACNKWNDILGAGGFGEVYKGVWNGQNIAVKRLRNDKKPKDIPGCGDEAYQKYIEQTFTELQALHCYPAENILPLLAFSFDEVLNTEPCLIYLHMVNGSVMDRLYQKNDTPPLCWDIRANIALGTSRGLCHLHANNIIHGDIKSGNILLDTHFEPKIGDFGLARGGCGDEVNTHFTTNLIVGTRDYLPEDFMRNGRLTPEVDTFSFGIFLFELVSGKAPSAKVGRITVRDIMLETDKIDPKMVDKNYGEKDIIIDPMRSKWPLCLFRLGKDCTNSLRKNRPAISKVFSALDFLHKHPSLQEKAKEERREPLFQVHFPAPIPTVLDSEASNGIFLNASNNMTVTDSSQLDTFEMGDGCSRSSLHGPPTNTFAFGIRPMCHNNLFLNDQTLSNISEHISEIYDPNQPQM